MGESKRRKKLDPSYGISKKITVAEFARQMYEKYGVGLIHIKDNALAGYILPTQSDINDRDRSLMKEADYNDTFPITFFMGGTIYVTGIFDKGNRNLTAKVLVNPNWLDTSEKYVHR